MKSVLIIVIVLAALVTIASGIWVAKALLAAMVTEKKGQSHGQAD